MTSILTSIIIAISCIFAPIQVFSASIPETRKIEIKESKLKNVLLSIGQKYAPSEDNVFSIKLHDGDEDMVEGQEDRQIYYLLDKEGEIVSIMKVRDLSEPSEAGDHEEEYATLSKFHSLNKPHFHSVAPLGKVEVEVEGKTLGIIIQMAVPGKSINSYLKSYHNTDEKTPVLDEMRTAMKELGMALGDLHNHSLKYRIHQSYKNRFDYVQKEWGHQVYKTLPGPFGYIHSDPHPGNIYFDNKTGQISFIDVEGAYNSFSHGTQNGGPLGYDLADFLLTFEILGTYYGMDEADIKDLLDTFLDSYRSHTNFLVSEETIDTYYALLLVELNLDDSPCGLKQKGQCQHFVKVIKKRVASLERSY